MQDDVLEIPVVPELDAFKAGMAELPAIGDKATKDMAAKMGSGFAAAEKSGKAAAKGVGTGFSAEFNKIAGAAGALSGAVGGSFGKIGSIANSALRPLAEVGMALGPAGLAGAIGVGLVAAAAAGAAAVIQLGDAAGAAGERLDKLGMLTLDQSLAAERLRDANVASAVATDQLTVAMGTASPKVEELTLAWVGLKAAMADAVNWAAEAREGLAENETMAKATDGALFQLGGQFGLVGIAASLLAEHYDELVEKGEELTAVVKEQGEVMALVYGPTPDQLAEVAKSHRELAAAVVAAEKLQADETVRIRTEMLARLEELDQQEIAQSQAVRDAMLADNKDKLDARADYHDTYLSMLQAEGKALSDAEREAQESTAAFASAWTTLGAAIGDAFESSAQRVVDSYEARAAAGEELSETEKKEAMAAFNVAQGFAIAQAYVQAALVGIGVTAQLAPYTGIAAPIIGASTASLLLATTLSSIANTPPPEFPMGMTPDHRAVGIRDDEGVANGRAMRALGGPEVLDDLNHGMLPGGGDLTVYLQVDREVLGMAVAKVTGGSAAGVVRAARGRRPVYGGGY